MPPRFNSARLIPCLPILLYLTGCMTPPVLWRHDPGDHTWEPSGYSLVVERLRDRRDPLNEQPSPLRWVPLVLYTNEIDRMFDHQLRQPGTTHGSRPVPNLRFDASGDLQRAIDQQLGRAGLFAPVLMTEFEDEHWTDGEKRRFTLRPTLQQLSLTTTHLRYGLGPVAPVAFALGAPSRRLGLEMSLSLEVAGPDGRLRWNKTIERRKAFLDGWFFDLAAEQRVLDFISLSVAQALDELQATIAEDLLAQSTKGEK